MKESMGASTVYLRYLCIVLVIFSFSCTADRPQPLTSSDIGKLAPPSSASEFVLGPGDEILINVWHNDDLTRSIKIGPSGNIYPPLLGQIQARGLTVSQLKEHLTQGFSAYIKEPHVDVSLVSLASRKYHILGEVNEPGTFILQSPVLIWEAVSRSKGFTNDANRDYALIIRNEKDSARAMVVQLDMEGMFRNGIVNQAAYVYPGDIVYIAQTEIAGFERFMIRLQNILAPLISVERSIILGRQAFDVLKGKTSDDNVIVAP